MTLGEKMKINDDEFDPILYTYGLQVYEDLPPIEPLETKEMRNVRELVIAIDTSGSVQGEVVQNFLQKTYDLFMQKENFLSRFHIHILQCDIEIRDAAIIRNAADFERYINHLELKGFGGTDFRPVFELVDGLIDAGEFSDLRGLIYFTDGYGTFPEHKPGYQTAFVFLDDEYNDPDVPPWAIRLVLQDDEI
jgi:predicted metal-dependent peptidase